VPPVPPPPEPSLTVTSAQPSNETMLNATAQANPNKERITISFFRGPKGRSSKDNAS
jgi:hypothetical protein